MKNNYFILLALLGLLSLSLFQNENRFTKYHNDGVETILYSINPPPQRTGAPGEGNCTGCHSGMMNSADGVVDLTISGGPDYIPGESYPMTISSPGGSKNGFELVILDAANNQAGNLIEGPDTDVITAGGRKYIRQSASAGMTSWNFTWEAPAADQGELTAYFAVVKANNNGSAHGDEVFLGTTSLPILGADVKENGQDKAYHVFFDQSSRVLRLDYRVIDNNAKVVFNIQDLSGKQVASFDFGNQVPDTYHTDLAVPDLSRGGIYVLSLFMNNEVFNRKIFLN